MAIHRLRLFHSTAGAGSFHGWLDQWLINMEPWEGGDVTNESPPLAVGDDVPGEYHMGDLVFAWSEDKAIILDQIDQYAAAYCDWHRILYHVCTHDETEPSACPWEDVRDAGAVPSHIPELE